jgi:hypothetical protein
MQTLSAISTHLNKDLARLAAEYICPLNATPAAAAPLGHHEIAATIKCDDITRRMFRRVCRNGDVILATMLLERSGEHHWIEDCLASACRGGHTELIEYAIANGAHGWTFAHTAATCGGHLSIMDDMVARGCKVAVNCSHTKCKAGTLAITHRIRTQPHSVIIRACSAGHMDTIDYGISMGMDHYEDYLRAACQGGQMEIIDMMAKRGAGDWVNALFGACSGGHLSVVEFVLGKATVKNHLWHLLQLACANGYLDIVERLLELNPGTLRETLMNDACEGGNAAIVALCLPHCKQQDLEDGMRGAATGGHLGLIEQLTVLGACEWNQCLYEAAFHGHIRIVRYMVAKGATNIADSLRIAESHRHVRIAKYLASIQS